MARRPRRHWIFQIESSEGAETRQLRLPRDVVRGTIALVLIGVAIVSSAATRAFVNADGADRPVGRRAGGPEAELLALRAQIDSLRGSLDELTSRDEYFRLLAGLEPLFWDTDFTGCAQPVSQTSKTGCSTALSPGLSANIQPVKIRFSVPLS